MRSKIIEFQAKARHKIERRLKRLCGKPSPAKRLMAVLFIGVTLAAANVYFLVSSIYSIGKNDAEKELIKVQHIETLELRRDTIKNVELKIKNQDDGQQSNDGRE